MIYLKEMKVSAKVLTITFLIEMVLFLFPSQMKGQEKKKRPNILLLLADDWGVHAGVYGTKGIQTPTFDRLVEEGVSFERAFSSTPSCTPARGALLTGQHTWRLGPGMNLFSTLPSSLPVYQDLLEQAGYFVGYTRKGWGPGNVKAGGRTRNPAGPEFEDFKTFLEQKPSDQPFSFWFGSYDPHRRYSDELRQKMGIDPSEVEVPAYMPDVDETRKDIANYYAEVQRFDRESGELISLLKEAGELENTLIVMTGDHGWPFPRAKANLYDPGTHVPFVIWWPEKMKVDNKGRIISDFIQFSDLAPTFLQAAGVEIPSQMTGRSLLSILLNTREGRIEAFRSYALLALERHARCRKNNLGYPSRAIRTENYLYIRNYKPDRWASGSPYYRTNEGIFGDTDYGYAKAYMIDQAEDPRIHSLFMQSFGKRPTEELYELHEDPDQMHNLANDPDYKHIRKMLSRLMQSELKALEDPRALGEATQFDQYPYWGKHPYERIVPPKHIQRVLELDGNLNRN